MPQPLVAVVGATATGKTQLAIALAQAIRGEIVNADSRQVYRGMDIGTAKPTPAEQAAARHWLIDCADPDEPMTLARFLDLAQAALAGIHARGLTPIVAGGTGQYVWALLEGWQVPRVAPQRALRAELERLAAERGPEAVHALLAAEDAESARTIDARNVRRVIRAIEVTRATGRPFSAWRAKTPPAYDATVLGLALGRDALYARIDARVDAMLAGGLVDEVRGLVARGYGCDLPPMRSIGYREVCGHLRGEITLAQAAARIKTETHRLARMQHTWFRRDDPRIRWLDAAAPDVAARALAAVSAHASGPAR
jgi:tRNA dimethylallyltransferase